MGLLSRPGTLELMREAVRLGVETVGGLDPCGIDGDPIRHLEAIFSLAAEFDRGIDIHLHDPGELGIWQIARIVDFTERFERQGRVMISHAYCLGSVPWQRVAPQAERLAANGISLATTAPADRTVPPFLKLCAAGVNVCLGCDGIRDAWSPLGNGDMLEKAMMQAYRFDLCKDDELVAAFDAASLCGARALGLEGYGLYVGDRADLLLLPAENLPDAVVNRPAARTLLRAGQVIVEDGELLLDPRAGR
ncbi:amidohydrolase family protein [Marinobacterium aestuariivivens]|uniref:Amidohydrolase family protein n=1 Tax=Marinobacterium aestuariivivens TaxID=1698799 RepID=A0ABW2AA41_9GAMM